ncbi:OmpA family protein [Brevundimonas sp. GCM10030266]|uniref:OmpA family protein n=1 Tax=Brevundimonas sp. GCM10030266 TaxID=3273386 RepID=UPI003618E84E
MRPTGGDRIDDQTIANWDVPDVLSEERLRASRPVGRLALLFSEQETGGRAGVNFCTATLIAPDMVITAYHCTDGGGVGIQLRQARVTFGDVSPSVGEELLSVDVRGIVERDEELDYVILRLSRSVTEIQPMPLRRAPANDLYMDIVHYPLSLPMRLTRGCTRSGVPAGEGRVNHMCSTEQGSSGAPILTSRTYAFVGIHQTGTDVTASHPFNTGATLDALLAASTTLRSLAEAAPIAPPAAAPMTPPDRPTPPAVGPRSTTPAGRGFTIYFDWDRSDLTAEGQSVIRSIVDYYNQNPGSAIEIVGHTDTDGTATYNVSRSSRMARTVADALVSAGLPGAAMSIDGRGESQLARITGDGVREALNRRVEVRIRPASAQP